MKLEELTFLKGWIIFGGIESLILGVAIGLTVGPIWLYLKELSALRRETEAYKRLLKETNH